MHQLKGKTRKQVLAQLGDNYLSEYGGALWVYILGKTWFGKEKALFVEFDDEDVVISIEKIYIED